MKLIKILSILSVYGLDEKYPLWAEHDVIGFNVTPELPKEILDIMEGMGVIYSEEYNSLIMFV
jgi:hypothetical protein